MTLLALRQIRVCIIPVSHLAPLFPTLGKEREGKGTESKR